MDTKNRVLDAIADIHPDLLDHDLIREISINVESKTIKSILLGESNDAYQLWDQIKYEYFIDIKDELKFIKIYIIPTMKLYGYEDKIQKFLHDIFMYTENKDEFIIILGSEVNDLKEIISGHDAIGIIERMILYDIHNPYNRSSNFKLEITDLIKMFLEKYLLNINSLYEMLNEIGGDLRTYFIRKYIDNIIVNQV